MAQNHPKCGKTGVWQATPKSSSACGPFRRGGNHVECAPDRDQDQGVETTSVQSRVGMGMIKDRTPGMGRWGAQGEGGTQLPVSIAWAQTWQQRVQTSVDLVQAHDLRVCTIAGSERTHRTFLFFLMTSERLFVEAPAHIRGYRTRPRLRLRTRGWKPPNTGHCMRERCLLESQFSLPSNR